MVYRKIISLFDNTDNQPSKLVTKNWVEVNDDAHGTFITNSQTKFKTITLKSSLFDYSDVYILVKGTIKIIIYGVDATARLADRRNKQVISKNCAAFTDCISKINKNTSI